MGIIKLNENSDICTKECDKCMKKYHMGSSLHPCCLLECGQWEFCRGCKDGIYSEEFKNR